MTTVSEQYQLEQENKKLKEQVFNRGQIIGKLHSEAEKREQKLEQIQKYLDAEMVPDYGYPWHTVITKILKEN